MFRNLTFHLDYGIFQPIQIASIIALRECAEDTEPWRAAGSLEFSKLLMEKALVAVSPGIGFGPLGEGFVRFALVENDHRLKQAAAGIKKFLRDA
jgi:alanine-synthesizing transaminase